VIRDRNIILIDEDLTSLSSWSRFHVKQAYIRYFSHRLPKSLFLRLALGRQTPRLGLYGGRVNADFPGIALFASETESALHIGLQDQRPKLVRLSLFVPFKLGGLQQADLAQDGFFR